MSDENPRTSEFSDVDKSKDKQYFIDYLDTVRARPGVREGKELAFSLLALKPGSRVLDVGCGTGDDVMSLAKIVGEKGRAIGLDNSEAMITEARKRAAKSNTRNVEFHEGNVYRIAFPDGTFDGVIADRVFIHLEDPHKALGEMTRVAKNGTGRIVTHDPDWDSFIIDSEFKDVTRKITRMGADALKNGKAGGKLYGIFKEAGLVNVTVSGRAVVFTDYNPSFQHLQLEKTSRTAMEKGLISEGEQTRWITDIQKRGEDGRFFASFMTFTVAGTKPQAYSPC